MSSNNYDIETKLSRVTLEFYNLMIDDGLKKDFKKIRFYLYFLKNAKGDIFSDHFVKTKTSIVWPDNEELIIKLIFAAPAKRDVSTLYPLTEEELTLIKKIYDYYKHDSSNQLQNLVMQNWNSRKIYLTLPFVDQINLALDSFRQLSSVNEMGAYNLLMECLKSNNIDVHESSDGFQLTLKKPSQASQ